MSGCSVDGCDRKHYGRGFCQYHYQIEWRKLNCPPTTKGHAPIEERFWRYVAKADGDQCWNWTGAISGGGYGVIQKYGAGNGRMMAHRLSHEMHNGPVLPGVVVMHKCDNRACVNPAHLQAGTQHDNIMDAVHKRRMKSNLPPVPFGEKHPYAKLKDDDVREIRQSSLSVRKLAAIYGVSPSTIHAAKTGSNWSRLE